MKWIDTRKLIRAGLCDIQKENKRDGEMLWVSPYMLETALKRGIYIFRNKLNQSSSKYDNFRQWNKEDIIDDIWNIKACHVQPDGTWRIPFNKHLRRSEYEGVWEFHIYTGGTLEELREALKILDMVLYDNYIEKRFNIEITAPVNGKLSTIDMYVRGEDWVSEWIDFIRQEVSKELNVKGVYIPTMLERDESFCTVWKENEFFKNKKAMIRKAFREFEKNEVYFLDEAIDAWELLPKKIEDKDLKDNTDD